MPRPHPGLRKLTASAPLPFSATRYRLLVTHRCATLAGISPFEVGELHRLAMSARALAVKLCADLPPGECAHGDGDALLLGRKKLSNMVRRRDAGHHPRHRPFRSQPDSILRIVTDTEPASYR